MRLFSTTRLPGLLPGPAAPSQRALVRTTALLVPLKVALLGLLEPMALILGSPGPLTLLLGALVGVSLGTKAPPLMGLLRPVPLRVDPPALLLVLLVGLVLAPGLMLRVWLVCLARICWLGVWLMGSWRLGWCWWAAASLVWLR